jgi:hypothetical protein
LIKLEAAAAYHKQKYDEKKKFGFSHILKVASLLNGIVEILIAFMLGFITKLSVTA